MKKIDDNQPLYAISVKFAEGIDFSKNEGEIIQVYLSSRGTSIPMVVTTADSEAKKHGQDGLFTTCSQKCGEKMKASLAKELKTFTSFADADL
jgi:hypothetical protein